MGSVKNAKEAFVSGHEGGSPYEILLVLASVPVGMSVYARLEQRKMLNRFVTEALAFCVPMLLCQTCYLYTMAVPYMSVCLMISWHSSSVTPIDKRRTSAVRQCSLTVHRATTMLLTFIAILAVDFQLFPRRFVKTETVGGYSLMDLGAASFCVAAGFVSSRARRTKMRPARLVPILIMGCIRLLAHKGIEYQEHVTEYGVHWNFFFTLALLIPVSWLVPGPTWYIPVTIMLIYQYCLSQREWQKWVLEAPRHDDNASILGNLFMANREGMLGVVSLAALFLASEYIAATCLWKFSFRRLVNVTIAVYQAWRTVEGWGTASSRRTTNLTFCLWVLFVNCLLLVVLLYIVQWTGCVEPPPVLDAMNRNGFFMFVAANIMTGLVNLSVNTMEVSDGEAASLLTMYVANVCALAVAVERGKNWLRREKEEEN